MESRMEWRGPQVTEFLEDRLTGALRDAAEAIEINAATECPVDTGRLQASITNEVEGKEARIGTDVSYAIYVELGTRKMNPQPYLRPALYGTDISAYFADILKE